MLWWKKFICFKLLPLKIYAIIKTVYCFNWLPWKSTRSSHWEVFLEINFNQKHWNFIPLVCIKRTSADLPEERMLCYGTSMNINILLTCLLKTCLTHFMAMVFYYTSWNTSETQRFPDDFRGHWKTSAMKWVNGHLIFSYLFCFLFK